MKFIYTREKAKDIKEQLEVKSQGGEPEVEFAANTDSFLVALNSAITPIAPINPINLLEES